MSFFDTPDVEPEPLPPPPPPVDESADASDAARQLNERLRQQRGRQSLIVNPDSNNNQTNTGLSVPRP